MSVLLTGPGTSWPQENLVEYMSDGRNNREEGDQCTQKTS